ncbi:MAG: hypothetical protein ABFS32_00930 [Bacteroidota bacterium]
MKFPNSQIFINKLNNLFNILLAIPLLLVGYGYLEISDGSWTALMEPTNAIVIGMSIVPAILVMYLSLKFKSESRKLTIFDELEKKMDSYYSLATFYYWSVFALSMMSAILLYLFAHMAFAIVYAFILFWVSVFRPTIKSIADLFGLKDEEKRKFLNKESLEE